MATWMAEAVVWAAVLAAVAYWVRRLLRARPNAGSTGCSSCDSCGACPVGSLKRAAQRPESR